MFHFLALTFFLGQATADPAIDAVVTHMVTVIELHRLLDGFVLTGEQWRAEVGEGENYQHASTNAHRAEDCSDEVVAPPGEEQVRDRHLGCVPNKPVATLRQ